MSSSSKKQDQWSILLAELGLEETAMVTETAVEPSASVECHIEQQETYCEETDRAKKHQVTGQKEEAVSSKAETAVCSSQLEMVKENFRHGAVAATSVAPASKSSRPSSPQQQKPVKQPGKPGKKSFIDRLASINLFGSTSPGKVDRSGAVPGDRIGITSLTEELQPKTLEKADQEMKTKAESLTKERTERAKETAVSASNTDPWSQLAAQLGVKMENKVKGEEAEKVPVKDDRATERIVRKAVKDPVVLVESRQEQKNEQADKEIDIESLGSFRDLKKPKTAQPVSPDVARTVLPLKSTSDLQNNDWQNNREEPTDSRQKPDVWDGRKNRDSRGGRENRRERGRGRERNQSSQEKWTERPIDETQHFYSEMSEPSQEEPGFQSRRHNQRRNRRETDSFMDNNELTKTNKFPKAEVTKTNSVIGQIPSFGIQEETGEEAWPISKKRSQREERDRYQKKPTRTIDDVQNDFEVDEVLSPLPEREYGPSRNVFADLFPEEDSGGSKPGKLTRGSRPRKEQTAFREPVESFEKPSFERESTRRSGRERKNTASVTDPQIEQEISEIRDMVPAPKSIPNWDDVVLPIIERNMAKHGNRRPESSGRNRGKRS